MKKRNCLPSQKVNLILFSILLVIGYGGAYFGRNSGGLPLYLMLSIPVALALMVIIGFQDKIKNSFIKATFSAYLSILAVLIIFNLWALWTSFVLENCFDPFLFFVIIPVSQMFFWVSLPLVENLDIPEVAAYFFAVASWFVAVFLMGGLFWLLDKSGNKLIRLTGQVVLMLIFSVFFYYYLWQSIVDACSFVWPY